MTFAHFSQIVCAVPTAIFLLGGSGPAVRPSEPAPAAQVVTIAPGTIAQNQIESRQGKPLVNLRNARTLAVEPSGPAEVVRALGSESTPTALAVGDFDADGAPDLVTGYRTANGGVVTLTRGNPDAFAPTDPTLFQKAIEGNVPATFVGTTAAFAVPKSPDFLAVGDFNRDGFRDLLVGTNGGKLYLLAGDGHGNLGKAQAVTLTGAVRALDVLADGHTAVSVEGPEGPQVVILAPGTTGMTVVAVFATPGVATSLAWGSLGSGADLAVGAGDSVMLIYGALGQHPQTETVGLGFSVAAVTVGDYIWDRDGRQEIAVLGSDGAVRILEHGTLDTRPLTTADAAGRRAALRARPGDTPNAMALGPWTVAKQLPYAGSAVTGPVASTGFSSPRLAASKTYDVMVLDAGKNRLSILDTSGETANASAAMDLSGTPVAAVALPQKINAARDVVVLTTGATPLVVAEDAPDPTFNVNTTADIDTVGACATNSTVTSSTGTLSLREAVCEANNNGAATSVINVPAGTYDLAFSTFGGGDSGSSSGELQVGLTAGANITISGAGQGDTLIQQTNGKDRIIEQDELYDGNISVTVENVTLQLGSCTVNGLDCTYGGGAILGLGNTGDALTLTDVTVNENNSGGTDDGGGIAATGNGTLTITGSTFSNNTAPSGTNGGAAGGGLYFNINASAGGASIMSSTFTGNSSTLGGAGAWLEPSTGDAVTISGSTFTGNNNTADPGGALDISQGGSVTVSDSRIAGNTASGGASGVYFSNAVATTITNNWWGCNAGPNASGCDLVVEDVSGTNESYTPSTWLVLSISASSPDVGTNGSVDLLADLTHNSDGTGGFSVPNGTPVTFGGTLDSSVNPTSTTLTSGQRISTYTAGGSTGTGSGTAKVDTQTVSVTIDIDAPPSFTSADSTTFTVGTSGSFNVTANGTPAPTFSFTGSLPSGVTLSTAGLLSGTPAGGTGGVYDITITASNGFGTPATQGFTLTVDQAPAITSGNSTTFAPGTSGSFPVTASGYPAPTFSETGAALPGTVTLSSGGSLSGTPGAGTGGTYGITITASNGVGTNATQSFTLTVSPSAMTISWTPIGTIIAGDAGASVLNASASCGACGTFSYTESQGGAPVGISSTTSLAPGTYTITANFNPTNPAAWSANSAQATLVVSGESVWIVDSGGGTSELAGNGYGITSSADPGENTAVGIDAGGNVWTVGSGAVEETSQIGTVQNTISSGGGLDLPVGIAIDGNSQVWVTNGNSSVSLFSNAGTALSPSTGFTDSSLATPSGIAIDLGGSVWVANKGNNSVTRILGAAVPVAPLSTAAANNKTGAKP
jgi:hypothetical protein